MAYCGDGVQQEVSESVDFVAEQCDDGNAVNDDGCTNGCQSPRCGDMILQTGEQCDEGDGPRGHNVDPGTADPTDPKECTTECKHPCGDGHQSTKEECDDGGDGMGDGCYKCKKEYLMFVTAESYQGNFGGPEGADKNCQYAAQKDGGPNLPGTYKAWVSINNDAANTDLPKGKALIRRDGVEIVSNAENLKIPVDLSVPVNIDENKKKIMRGEYAWTGSGDNGSPTTFDCDDFTTNSVNKRGTVGQVDQQSSLWTSDPATQTCDVKNHLYCFRID